VVGTHQYHAFLPISNTTLIAKKYSKAQDGSVVAVAESRSQSQTIRFETV
jgi:ribosomal protein S17